MKKPLPHRALRFMSWLGRYELATLVIWLCIAGGIWGFVELADEVKEGETHAFDEKLLLMLHNPANLDDPLGPHWVESVGRDFTALGSMAVLAFLTLAVIGFLALQRKTGAALLVFVAVGGGALLSTLLKLGFDRPRPDLVAHGAYVYTASFPSGHSMLSAATYLTLGALLARVQPKLRLKAYLLILAILLTLIIGISRVYLGVHWPTDVLAGWTVGAAWALLCWLVARWLQTRGQVERDSEELNEQEPADPIALQQPKR